MPDVNTSKTAAHEPGSLRDGTANLEGGNKSATIEDAIELGHKEALANHKAEQRDSTLADTPTQEETIKDAQESAKLNHEVDVNSQSEQGNGELRNDTSKTAKINTAKAQLDPAGDDPIKESEIEKSATNASMETGNKTEVSNKEAAKRAANPGKAEEDSPRSIAGSGPKRADVKDSVAHPNSYQKVAHPNTNSNQRVGKSSS